MSHSAQVKFHRRRQEACLKHGVRIEWVNFEPFENGLCRHRGVFVSLNPDLHTQTLGVASTRLEDHSSDSFLFIYKNPFPAGPVLQSVPEEYSKLTSAQLNSCGWTLDMPVIIYHILHLKMTLRTKSFDCNIKCRNVNYPEE